MKSRIWKADGEQHSWKLPRDFYQLHAVHLKYEDGHERVCKRFIEAEEMDPPWCLTTYYRLLSKGINLLPVPRKGLRVRLIYLTRNCVEVGHV